MLKYTHTHTYTCIYIYLPASSVKQLKTGYFYLLFTHDWLTDKPPVTYRIVTKSLIDPQSPTPKKPRNKKEKEKGEYHAFSVLP